MKRRRVEFDSQTPKKNSKECAPESTQLTYGSEFGIFAGLPNLWSHQDESTVFMGDWFYIWYQQHVHIRELEFEWDKPEEPKPNQISSSQISQPHAPGRQPANLPPKFEDVKHHAKVTNPLSLRLPRELLQNVLAALKQGQFSEDTDYSKPQRLQMEEQVRESRKRKRAVVISPGAETSDTETSVFSRDESEEDLPQQSDTPRMDAKVVGQKLYKQYCEKSSKSNGSKRAPAALV